MMYGGGVMNVGRKIGNLIKSNVRKLRVNEKIREDCSREEEGERKRK